MNVIASYTSVGSPGREVARTLDMGNGVLVDLDADSRAIGLEMIGQSDPTAALFAILREGRFV